MKYINKLTGFLAALALLSACTDPYDVLKRENSGSSQSIIAVLEGNANLSTFVSKIKSCGFEQFLSAQPALTVFAPTNAALAGVTIPTDSAALVEWLQNYVTGTKIFTDTQKQFSITQLRMFNGKNVVVSGSLVSGAQVQESNLSAINGVVHVIDNIIELRLSVWEYLQTQSGYPQVNYIKAFTQMEMDKERSVQTGVDMNGRPIYDTVWVERNTFLEKYPLADEQKLSTFVLLEVGALNLLYNKYAKYMHTEDSTKQAGTVLLEICNDLILPYTKIESSGRYPNFDGVLVDIDVANIVQTYNASNGVVYVLSAAAVKMYENKIKTVQIEAEDFVTCFPAASWTTRFRTWASAGRDVVLKSFHRNYYEYTDTITYPDSVVNVTLDYRYDIVARNNEPGNTHNPNAFISYKPRMYSTGYRIYWKAYDDNANHVANTRDGIRYPMEFDMKMYISMPGRKVLQPKAGVTTIENNFSSYSLMAASMVAGENVETRLTRWRINNAVTGFTDCAILSSPFTEEDAFGKNELLICPTFGTATFFISNTCRDKKVCFGADKAILNTSTASSYPGLMYLDYLKLEPIVDPND